MRHPLHYVLVTLITCGSLSACTAITEAGDYEVDPTSPDLSFTAINFVPHVDEPLNVAVVSQNEVLLARAVTILPLHERDKFPDENIQLRGVLPLGQNKLYFFVDKNRDGKFNPAEGGDPIEHVWIENIPADGVLEFPHDTNFNHENFDGFDQQHDIVFEMPRAPAGATPAQIAVARTRFMDAGGDKFELRVRLSEDGPDVGLFRRYSGTMLPAQEIVLEGIADAGNFYDWEFLIDDEVQDHDEGVRAPTDGDLRIEANEWLPSELRQAFDDAF